MLSNDMAHQWTVDKNLGEKISLAMNYASDPKRQDMARIGSYGRVVECVHADNQTLAMLGFYTTFRSIDGQSWMQDESDDEAAVRLLKSAANKLGYRLVKQPTK
jgi:hypothetical protein